MFDLILSGEGDKVTLGLTNGLGSTQSGLVLSESVSYMSTPAEVGHLLQSSISEFPLKEFVDLRRQEVTDLQTQEAGTCVKVTTVHIYQLCFYLDHTSGFNLNFHFDSI